jgi:superfamily II DNA or RNA helicase
MLPKEAAPPISVGAAAAFEFDAERAKRFTLLSRFDEEFALFEQRGSKMLLPRNCVEFGPNTEDLRTDGEPVAFKCKVKPRSAEQKKFIRDMTDLLEIGDGFIAQAPTGFGKTVCAIPAIASCKTTTLIVVTKEDLILQWYEALTKFTDLTKDDIGEIRQNVCDVQGRKVVIGMVHSLSKEDRYPPWITRYFGLVVFDEVHRLGAETFSRAASLFAARRRMGLSATPDRADGKEILFEAHIGPVRCRAKQLALTPEVIVTRSEWRCPRRSSGQLLHQEVGRTMGANKSLAESMKRTDKICSIGYSAWKKGRNIIVFSELLDHLEMIRIGLNKYGVPHSDMAKYVGGLSKTAREKATQKRILLATYKMCSEGTDIPKLDTAILATPRSNVIQTVGRILREHPDKQKPVVIDVVDDDSPLFEVYFKKRLKWYKQIGAKVQFLK